MAVAAHPGKYYVRVDATAATSPDEILGIDSVEFKAQGELVEITDFKDTSGAKKRLATLADGSATLSGMAEFADAPQTLFRSYGPGGANFGASLWLTAQFNPAGAANAKGFQVECKVESYSVKAGVASRVDFEVSLSFTGAIATV